MATSKQVKYIASNKSSDDEHPVLLEDAKKRKNRGQLRLAFYSFLLGVPIVFSLYLDIRYLTRQKQYAYNDVLSPIQKDNVNWNRLDKYVRYIVSKVKIHGIDEISGKWARNVPPEFRQCSKNKLEILGAEGFYVTAISLDPKNIYRVKCISNTTDKDVVFFDIVKEKQWNGDKVFRLVKVY